MTRGKQLSENKLIPFNSRIKEDTKELIDAIVALHVGVNSTREFIEKSLELFKKEYPATVDAAEAYLELKRKIT